MKSNGFRRWLLRAYPARFRDEYGQEMSRLYTEQPRDAAENGWRGPPLVVLRVIVDTLRTAPREHLYLIREDVRHALRALTKAPGFALVAVSTLAIGIGATTAMFSVADAVLWRALPFAEPSRLVRVAEARIDTAIPTYSSLPNYADWQDQSDVFESMAAFTDQSLDLTGVAEPEHLNATQITASLLPRLGARPLLGRNFLPAEDVRGASPTAILSHQLWRRAFGADPDVLGRPIVLSDRVFTVVAVMPADFKFPVQVDPIDVYTPIGIDEFQQMRARDGRLVHVIARLKHAMTIQGAQDQMALIARRLEQAHPGTNDGWGVLVQPMHEWVSGSNRAVLLTLLGAVASVLLMTCVNLASLVLARTARRWRDFAVRTALRHEVMIPGRLAHAVMT